MIDILVPVILGLVEGITEFLPISSTGHLIVVSALLGAEASDATFEIVIQLGAVLAVVWFYRTDLLWRVTSLRSDPAARVFWRNLTIASLPAIAVGLALGDWVTSVLFSPLVVALALIVGGVVLWVVDDPGRSRARVTERPATTDHQRSRLDGISARQALAIGIVQTTALVPGVSRAGSSIVGAMLVGLDRPTATAFSFYLAIPTLGGATAYSLVKNLGSVMERGGLATLALGTAVSFVVAALVIGWLLRYVGNHSFRVFAIYRIVFGALILVVLARA